MVGVALVLGASGGCGTVDAVLAIGSKTQEQRADARSLRYRNILT